MNLSLFLALDVDPDTKEALLLCILGAITLALIIGGVRVSRNWPKGKLGHGAVAILLIALPLLPPLLVSLIYLTEGAVALFAIVVVPLAWLGWLALAITAVVVIKMDADKYDQERQARRIAAQARPNQPYSAGPLRAPVAAIPRTDVPDFEPEAAQLDGPVIARCASCMGRWKTTKADAGALEACPKCGASPPELRLQRVG
jgi:hypothetical protein